MRWNPCLRMSHGSCVLLDPYLPNGLGLWKWSGTSLEKPGSPGRRDVHLQLGLELQSELELGSDLDPEDMT